MAVLTGCYSRGSCVAAVAAAMRRQRVEVAALFKAEAIAQLSIGASSCLSGLLCLVATASLSPLWFARPHVSLLCAAGSSKLQSWRARLKQREHVEFGCWLIDLLLTADTPVKVSSVGVVVCVCRSVIIGCAVACSLLCVVVRARSGSQNGTHCGSLGACLSASVQGGELG